MALQQQTLEKFTLSLDALSCERDERLLFSQLSGVFAGGTVVHVTGPNGAGKSTLMRIITGLTSDFEGAVRWCGEAARGYGFLSSLLYLGHATGVNSSLTPLENLAWYFGLNGVKSVHRGTAAAGCVSIEQFNSALARVGLYGYGDVPCSHMSAGQQRRVALARLYISQAPLWVLDEPFTAIDKSGVEHLEARILEHTKGGGIVLLTTHQASNLGDITVLDLSDFKGGAL